MLLREILKKTPLHGLYYRILHLVPDRIYVTVQYKNKVGKWPNLKNPSTFNEKLNWIKLNERDPKLTVFCDKLAVRDFVSKKIGDEFLIPLLGVYESFDEIDFSLLPNQFVIKATHDSGSVIICKEKKQFDFVTAKYSLDSALESNYFYVNREWPYKNIKPRLIVEKLLNESIIDYKFFVFNGEAQYLYLGKGLVRDHSLRIAFFDMDGNKAPFGRMDYPLLEEDVKMPNNFKEMKKIAEILANDLPFVRVDLYSVGEKIYFSEMTLTPAGGYTPFLPDEYDKILGEKINL